jgi:hypothetical protein
MLVGAKDDAVAHHQLAQRLEGFIVQRRKI